MQRPAAKSNENCEGKKCAPEGARSSKKNSILYTHSFQKRAAAAEARLKAKLEEEKIVVKSAIKPIEKKEEEKQTNEDKGVVKAKADQISGPKVVGKIELPLEKAKTSEDGKRKRVRVKKIDVKKQANATRKNKVKNQKKGGYVKKEVSQEDIQKEIRETLARLSGGKKSKSSKLRREKRKNVRERHEDELVQQQLEENERQQKYSAIKSFDDM